MPSVDRFYYAEVPFPQGEEPSYRKGVAISISPLKHKAKTPLSQSEHCWI
jgi:hypothetical protein